MEVPVEKPVEATTTMTTQQPVATEPMSATTQPPAGPERDFKHGLFSCTDDCGTCCMACWCPCITYSKNITRYRYLQQHGQPHPQGGESCGQDGLFHCALTACFGAGWVLQIILRGDVRKRYGIAGSLPGDFFATCCCSPCEQTQESLELEENEKALRANSQAQAEV